MTQRAALGDKMSRTLWIWATVIAALFSAAMADPGHAQTNRDCRLREGPSGPCTCRGVGADELVTVARERCQPRRTEPGKADARTEKKASAASHASTLAAVTARGRLVCGVNGDLPGFSMMTKDGRWSGLDVDFCRAVAAAVLGDAQKTDFVPLSVDARFDALAKGSVDLLARNTTWTLEREVEYATGFAGVLWYDGQGFMTKADTGYVSAQQLAAGRVCVLDGTTTERNARFFFRQIGAPETKLVLHKIRSEMLKAYEDGACAAYTADRTALFADRSQFPKPDRHVILPEVISREPLGPVVRADDPAWARIVRWVLTGLINAEEEGLHRRDLKVRMALPAGAQRLIDGSVRVAPKAGLRPEWLQDAVRQVGSYRDLFDDNLGSETLGMQRGLNALWRDGGILYAPPVW